MDDDDSGSEEEKKRIRFRNVKTQKSRGNTYHYFRPTMQRLPGEYGSQEFLSRLYDLNEMSGFNKDGTRNTKQAELWEKRLKYRINISQLVFKVSDDERSGNDKIYFLQIKDSGRVKVGITKNLKQRLIHYKTHTGDDFKVLGSTPGTKELETRIKAVLDHHNASGEWFEPHEEVYDVIEAVLLKNIPRHPKTAGMPDELIGALFKLLRKQIVSDTQAYSLSRDIMELFKVAGWKPPSIDHDI